MSKKQELPQVEERLQWGYIQTTNIVDETADNKLKIGILGTVGTEIDSALYLYNQTTASFYMNNYYRTNYGENAMINIPVNTRISDDHMAVYSQLWKLNEQLRHLYSEYYRCLDSSTTIRVYNNEPIIISTPSRAGYSVIHPSLQDLEIGNDEYGNYYEANLGGAEDCYACINGMAVAGRRLIGRRLR